MESEQQLNDEKTGAQEDVHPEGGVRKRFWHNRMYHLVYGSKEGPLHIDKKAFKAWIKIKARSRWNPAGSRCP